MTHLNWKMVLDDRNGGSIMSRNSYLTIAISILTVLSLAFLSGCGSSSSNSSNNTTDGTTGVHTDQINVSNFTFNPSTIIVTAETTVTWTNKDSAKSNRSHVVL